MSSKRPESVHIHDFVYAVKSIKKIPNMFLIVPKSMNPENCTEIDPKFFSLSVLTVILTVIFPGELIPE